MKNLLLPLSLVLAGLSWPTESQAYPASHYASSSVLSEGHWVKVEVDTTSIFEISYDELRAMGFSNPADVTVWGRGAIGASNHRADDSYPDDLPVAAFMHTNDGRVLFYGEGTRRGMTNKVTSNLLLPTFSLSYYDTHSYYFLTDSRKASAPVVSKYKYSGGNVLDWHYCIDLQEEDVQNPTRGGVFFHGPELNPGDTETHTFRIRDFYKGNEYGYIRYESAVKIEYSAAFSSKIDGLTPSTQKNYSASTINSSSGKKYETGSGMVTFTSSASYPLDDAIVKYHITVPTTFSGEYAAIDRVYALYPRKNILRESPLYIDLYNISAGQEFRIEGADSNTKVWNVTETWAVKDFELIADSGSGRYRLSIPGSGNMKFIAFDTSAKHRKVSNPQEVRHTNLHAEKTPDMLIVTTETNLPAAQELAAIHTQLRGFDVVVAVQDDIFNEFSYGIRHPGAFRRLAKMFYDRNPDKLRYITLYGRPVWDNRFLVHDKGDYLVSFQVESAEAAKDPTTNACADQFFGMLSDDFTISSMATTQLLNVSVGRIPVDNPSVGRAVNTKIREQLLSPMSARGYLHAVFISDKGDEQAHILQANQVDSVLTYGRPEMSATRADLILYPLIGSSAEQQHTLIHHALGRGTGFFNYSGHADSRSLTGSDIYDVNTLEAYTYHHYPLAMLSTCSTWTMDFLPNALCEKMLYKESGGMIGIIAACRSVYLEPNRTLNVAVADQYRKAAAGTTGGDIFRLARNKLIAEGGGRMSSALANNTLCYNFCGDPSIPIGVPDYSIAIDKFGEKISDSNITADPLANLAIEARVTNAKGETLTSFNGAAIIDVYESPEIRKSNQGSPAVSVTCDDDIMVSIPATVSAGRISLSAPVPVPARTGAYNRVVITAISDSDAKQAAGATDKVLIATEPSADSDVDTSAPVIEAFYIDTPEFNSGDIISSDIEVNAIIVPSATGLAYSTFKIAPSTSLVLDGHVSYPEAISSIRFIDGKAYLSSKIFKLPDGRHSLTLKAVNNCGESTSATIDFDVIAAPLDPVLSLDAAGPLRTSADFDLDTKGTDLTDSHLIITDSKGATVFSRSVTFPFSWDFTGIDGTKVPDGSYSAHIKASTAGAKGGSNTVDFIIIK
ncbi:MAG: hypothetical protein HDS65_02000 [Bacteroidales bacterium]|nr:hypothetical protein [Bacteroidales bacterium]